MMRAILIFITAIYYTLPQLMTDPNAINRLITTPCPLSSSRVRSVSKKSGSTHTPFLARTMRDAERSVGRSSWIDQLAFRNVTGIFRAPSVVVFLHMPPLAFPCSCRITKHFLYTERPALQTAQDLPQAIQPLKGPTGAGIEAQGWRASLSGPPCLIVTPAKQMEIDMTEISKDGGRMRRVLSFTYSTGASLLNG